MVDALLTVTVAAPADELAKKSALPPYEAVTESDPRGNVVRSMLADVTPSVVDNIEVPSAVAVEAERDGAVGAAVPVVGATVAVSVTLWPDVDADGDGTTLVVVDTG